MNKPRYAIEWFMTNPQKPAGISEIRDGRPIRSVVIFSQNATVAEATAMLEGLENLARKLEKFQASEEN